MRAGAYHWEGRDRFTLPRERDGERDHSENHDDQNHDSRALIRGALLSICGALWGLRVTPGGKPRTGQPLFGRYGQMGRSEGPSFGVRYDLADYAGLKLQYGRLSQRNLPWTNDFQIQFAFAF